MRAIWKFPFGEAEHMTFPGIKIVHVEGESFDTLGMGAMAVHSFPTVWAEVDPEGTDNHNIKVTVVGTGHPIPDGWRHVGSAIMGRFVWHVMERCDATDDQPTTG
jgi:hypothetical protein